MFERVEVMGELEVALRTFHSFVWRHVAGLGHYQVDGRGARKKVDGRVERGRATDLVWWNDERVMVRAIDKLIQ